MKSETPVVKYLADYKAPTHKIETVELEFHLDDTKTQVYSKMEVVPVNGQTLELNGEELILKSVKVNGEEFKNFNEEKEILTLSALPTEKFTLEIHNEINPKANTALDGLYKSGGMFCTQNEPEGFRRITYFIDRPDNLSIFTTKIVADKKDYPFLLSNGNLIEKGDLDGGKHFAIWNDPFAKPAYLYALVAGDLALIEDTFKTKSGRDVKLQVFVDKGNEDKSHHAMESLKKSMKWDEDRFRLEYDLDIYMIVAVDSFNMGAMENKGLNIFNSAYVLASKETAEDHNFFGIESVVGHEYFHNWTGNRVTCRDWFQLTLKEGLTVFRDQEFSADLNSRSVCRINDVINLRAAQFPEDAGPQSHPIQPKSYIEMNNFYTMTIYEKGSEVIRMYHTLLGEEGFQRGMDKYFELYDGQAVTTADFTNAMSVANDNYDFSQFRRWYDQAGTPVLDVTTNYDEEAKEFTLTVNQSTPATPGQPTKEPFHMPFVIGLLDSKGADMKLALKNRDDQADLNRGLLHIKADTEVFVFEGVSERPVASLNRNFSAPVVLRSDLTDNDFIFLMANDNDDFNRYEAGQALALKNIHALLKDENFQVDEKFIQAWGAILKDQNIDEEFKAVCLGLPSMTDVASTIDIPNYRAIDEVKEKLYKLLASTFEQELVAIYNDLSTERDFKVDAKAMGERRLRGFTLGCLAKIDGHQELARKCFEAATNMTDMMNSLSVMVHEMLPGADESLKEFYARFKDQTLVMQKWLSVQASSCDDTTFDRVGELMKDEVFDMNVPNLVSSLIGTFARNKVQFNHESGRGLKFIAEMIRKVDAINPQSGSRLAGAFNDYRKMPADLKEIARVELEAIVNDEKTSKNVFEKLSKTLNS
ncbi:aminopeptidase N [Halobacteriovorax sp. RZ-2]|uniref:aminopeptidase N n=1 Tax=unclassified Halobacteriovorax TaxID=2639665 RepID=UPI0037248FAD